MKVDVMKCQLRVKEQDSKTAKSMTDMFNQLDTMIDGLALVSEQYQNIVLPFAEEHFRFTDREDYAFYTVDEEDIVLLTLQLDPGVYLKVEHDI